MGMREHKRCINLTAKMHTCKSPAGWAVTHPDGYVSHHCARHYTFWYGRWGGLMFPYKAVRLHAEPKYA